MPNHFFAKLYGNKGYCARFETREHAEEYMRAVNHDAKRCGYKHRCFVTNDYDDNREKPSP